MAAKFVIAGKSDCPMYARAELLADELQLRLPSFHVHKIVLEPRDWKPWVNKTCADNGWTYDGSSPMVWRELINRGGKGKLLGGCNEFMEVAKGYYGLTCEKLTKELTAVAKENEVTKVQDVQKEIDKEAHCLHFNVVVVNATVSKCAYHLLPQLLSGNLFNDKYEIALTFYDPDDSEGTKLNLNGIGMELQDCAYRDLHTMDISPNYPPAFNNAHLVLILLDHVTNVDADDLDGSLPDLQLLKQYGQLINVHASDDVKVVIGGRSALTYAYVLSQFAAKVKKENIFAVTMVEENQLKSKIAKQLKVRTSDMENVLVWGDPWLYPIIDCSRGRCRGYEGAVWGPHIEVFSHSVNDVMYDSSFLEEGEEKTEQGAKKEEGLKGEAKENEITQKVNSNADVDVKKEGEAPATPGSQEVIVESSESSSSVKVVPPYKTMQASAAIMTQIQYLFKGSGTDQMYSLGLVSQGWYGVPNGMVFSFPVRYVDGEVAVQTSLPVEAVMEEKLKEAVKKITEVNEKVLSVLK